LVKAPVLIRQEDERGQTGLDRESEGKTSFSNRKETRSRGSETARRKHKNQEKIVEKANKHGK